MAGDKTSISLAALELFDGDADAARNWLDTPAKALVGGSTPLEYLETSADAEAVPLLKNICMHLYRNSMDHGIEMPEDRLEKGKPEFGTITMEMGIEGLNEENGFIHFTLLDKLRVTL